MPANVHVSTVEIDEKCFDKFVGPTKVFNQYNILFGQNGHGKTTLARHIYATALENGVKDSEIRAYDASYIKETLLINDADGKINSVKANFGKQNTDIEEEVAKLESEIVKLQEQLDGVNSAEGLLAQKETALHDIQTEIKTIHDTYKGVTTVKLKFSEANPFDIETLSAYSSDYTEGLKKFSSDDIKIASGSDNHEDNLERISGLPIHEPAQTDKISIEEIEQTAIILQKTYGGTTPDTSELDWISHGIKLHAESNDSCKFCSNALNLDEVKRLYASYASDSKVTDMLALKGIQTKLEAYGKALNELVNSEPTYKELYKEHSEHERDFEELGTLLIGLIGHGADITAKLDENNKVVIWKSDEIWSEFEKYETIIERIKSHKNIEKDSITLKINQQNILVKARIGLEVGINTLIAEKSSSHDELIKSITDVKEEIIDKNEKIGQLKSEKSEIANFAKYVNETLNSLGCEFKLVADETNKSYFLVHRNNSPITIKDISEGERNLLALLYFYFEMLQDDEKSLKTDIKIIIVDDPVASLDDENRFYILEVVKSLLADNDAQVFVFTHLWSSFGDMSWGRNGKPETNLYEIQKRNSISNVIVSNTQLQPYRRLYKQIHDFSSLSEDEIEDDSFLHMPNTMRRVLEDYLKFYAGIDNVTSKSKEKVSSALLKQEYSSLNSPKKLKLDTLLSVTNILSHRIPGSPSNTEIHDAARFMMNKMKDHHKEHHNAMKA